MLSYIIDPLFIYLSKFVGIGISRASTGLLSNLFLILYSLFGTFSKITKNYLFSSFLLDIYWLCLINWNIIKVSLGGKPSLLPPLVFESNA